MVRASSGRLRSLSAPALILILLAGAVWLAKASLSRKSARDYARLPRAAVGRVNLATTLTAGGRVQSSKRTLIECELENLSFSSEGRTFAAGGKSTILEIVPEGTNVARDDVLCRLDSSDYEELVRQQEIKVQQARSEYQVAALDLKAAEIGLDETKFGLLPQEQQGLEGDILLGKADLRRQADRLAWARRMLDDGYLSAGQFNTENDRLLKAKVALDGFLGKRHVLGKFTAPMTLLKLQMQIDGLRANLLYQESRLLRQVTRLDKFRHQVELCTIRAPHDGFVIYANEPDDDPRVEEGAKVYQKMDLFYLPDLSRMEIETVIHETVVDRVKQGMAARVRIEGLPKYALEGEVVGVDTLPLARRDTPWSDVKNYLGRIQLHSIPPGLLPGMTAEVEIETGRSASSLVIPSESVVADGDHDYCYVVHPDGLERRELQLGQGSRNLMEVTSGLEEGEEVLLDPAQGG